MDTSSSNDCWTNAALIRKWQIESGTDITFHKVFLPIYKEILTDKSNLKGLDIGAGTGHLANIIQPHFNELVAIEPSIGMYKVAKDILGESSVQVYNFDLHKYSLIAKSDFDFIYSHMCLHTIANVEEFIYSASRLLSLDGNFVFSIPHPCFYHLYKNYFGKKFQYNVEMSATVSLTISSDESNFIENIPYVHRSLEKYFNALSSSGLIIKRFIEAFPEESIHSLYANKWEAPRYCFFVCGFEKR